MENPPIIVQIPDDRHPSFIVRAAFNGSTAYFAGYLLFVCLGIFCYNQSHDATVLLFALFILLASLELYREQRVHHSKAQS